MVPQGAAQRGLPGRDPQGPEGRKCTPPTRRRPPSWVDAACAGGRDVLATGLPWKGPQGKGRPQLPPAPASAGGGGLADITAAEPDSLLLPDTTAPSEMTPACPDARNTGQDGDRPPSQHLPPGQSQPPSASPPMPTAPCPRPPPCPHTPRCPHTPPTLPTAPRPCPTKVRETLLLSARPQQCL